jgi:hypothetical protein
MESYEVLEKAIPKKASERVALLLNVSATYIRRWRREPESDDAPTASGQRSILDRICDLIDACFLVNPRDVGLIIEYINNHYNRLIQTHSTAFSTQHCQAKKSAELLKEAVEAVNKLNLDECDAVTLIELTQLRTKTDEAIASVQQTLKVKE